MNDNVTLEQRLSEYFRSGATPPAGVEQASMRRLTEDADARAPEHPSRRPTLLAAGVSGVIVVALVVLFAGMLGHDGQRSRTLPRSNTTGAPSASSLFHVSWRLTMITSGGQHSAAVPENDETVFSFSRDGVNVTPNCGAARTSLVGQTITFYEFTFLTSSVCISNLAPAIANNVFQNILHSKCKWDIEGDVLRISHPGAGAVEFEAFRPQPFTPARSTN